MIVVLCTNLYTMRRSKRYLSGHERSSVGLYAQGHVCHFFNYKKGMETFFFENFRINNWSLRATICTLVSINYRVQNFLWVYLMYIMHNVECNKAFYALVLHMARSSIPLETGGRAFLSPCPHFLKVLWFPPDTSKDMQSDTLGLPKFPNYLKVWLIDVKTPPSRHSGQLLCSEHQC